MSFQEAVKEKWAAAKPILTGLVIGLIAGPVILLWVGWVVTNSTMKERVHAALVEEEASICAARARAHVKNTTKLDYDQRLKLAEKWSVMPGEKPGSASWEVTSTCADKLSGPPEGTPSRT